MKSMGTLRVVGLWVGSLALLTLASALACKKETPPPPPPEVLVADVVQKDVPIVREWVGTLDGSVNAEIRPKVEGYVLKQLYTEGTFVKKGQPLFQIDPRQFKAALDQAKGNLERQEAALEKSDNDVKRYTPLAAEKAISQQELDNALSSQRANAANVAAAKAAVEETQLNLAWCTVTSPIDGIVGIAQSQVGALVNKLNVMTTVSTVDPIEALFQISEQEYLKTQAAKAQGFAIEALTAELVLADGSVYPHAGHPTVSDREVNVKTGTIAIKAAFPNPDALLRPGQFAKVRMAVFTAKDALLIPQKALTEMQGNALVAVVAGDGSVEMRPVKVGHQVGSSLIIEKGLNAGEKVVVEGIQKIRPGVKVAAKPAPAHDGKTPEAPAAAGR